MILNWSNENYSAIICKASVGTPGLCGVLTALCLVLCGLGELEPCLVAECLVAQTCTPPRGNSSSLTAQLMCIPEAREVFPNPDLILSLSCLKFPAALQTALRIKPQVPLLSSRGGTVWPWLTPPPSLLSPCLIPLLPGSHLTNPWSWGKDPANPSELYSNIISPHLARLYLLCSHSPCHCWQLCICMYGHWSHPCLHCTPPAGSYLPQAPRHEWEAASGSESELLPITYPSHPRSLLGSPNTTWLCPCSPGVGVTPIAELCVASPSSVGSSVLPTYL